VGIQAGRGSLAMQRELMVEISVRKCPLRKAERGWEEKEII